MTATQQDLALLEDICNRSDSELDVGVYVSHYIDATNSLQLIWDSLEDFFRSMPGRLASEDLLTFFLEEGFGVGSPNDVSACHSDLLYVMNTKSGIPISQALLLIGAARSAGLACHGINFPGHFLVRLEEQIVDPLKFEILDATKLEANVATSPRATPRMIALRMFNNLKALKLRGSDLTGALEIVDVQMRIANDAESRSSLHYERGEYWLRLGAHSIAREAFLKCAQDCPYPELAERANQQAAALDGADQTFH